VSRRVVGARSAPQSGRTLGIFAAPRIRASADPELAH
jgi:hypothetical protein